VRGAIRECGLGATFYGLLLSHLFKPDRAYATLLQVAAGQAVF
jgi:hypothetical protein